VPRSPSSALRRTANPGAHRYGLAQGAPLVYVAMVWWYARAMERIDRDAGFDDEDTP
jgi:uncharacterized membrane protein